MLYLAYRLAHFGSFTFSDKYSEDLDFYIEEYKYPYYPQKPFIPKFYIFAYLGAGCHSATKTSIILRVRMVENFFWVMQASMNSSWNHFNLQNVSVLLVVLGKKYQSDMYPI